MLSTLKPALATAAAIDRRAFLALAPAALAARAVAPMLTKLAWPAGRSSLFFCPGRAEWRDNFGSQHQAGLQRLWRLILAAIYGCSWILPKKWPSSAS